jgi:hypothetical protein
MKKDIAQHFEQIFGAGISPKVYICSAADGAQAFT